MNEASHYAFLPPSPLPPFELLRSPLPLLPWNAIRVGGIGWRKGFFGVVERGGEGDDTSS